MFAGRKPFSWLLDPPGGPLLGPVVKRFRLAVTEPRLAERPSRPAAAARLLRASRRLRAGARDVPGDAQDHLVARARLRELRDQRVPVIVPPPDNFRFLAHLRPLRP